MWVKICGVTTADDARLAADAGASAIGVNLWPPSKRYVDEERAAEIARAVRGRAAVVGIVCDRPAEEMRALREQLGLDWLQLHGDEANEALAAVLPRAYKAVRVGSAADLRAAAEALGDRVLVDAKIEGVLGGSGTKLDWALVAPLARERRVILAGGLTAEDVCTAIAVVSPFGVDVASGVEMLGDPRRKDPEKVRAFVANARAAVTRA
jgi:phosphoribosylanthranilate isomerase